MSIEYIFTSESVSEGHPDKVADQISDSVVDHFLSIDPYAHVACETMLHNEGIVIAGEYQYHSDQHPFDAEQIVALAHKCLADIGYDSNDSGYDGLRVPIKVVMCPQSSEIDKAVKKSDDAEFGAGDQGIMFGYACTDSDQFMPLPIELAHRLMRRQASLRKDGTIDWLRPDAKAQVSVNYVDRKPSTVKSVTLSTQHAQGVKGKDIEEAVIESIIKPIIPKSMRDPNIQYFINPSGSFVKGGPSADCGLTGRKIVVDTYGGMGRHGGGAFSGKDPTKVDRSASYAMRYVAKNVIAAQLASCCEVQISYSIGVAEPVSLMVDTFGTGKVSAAEIAKRIRSQCALTPGQIIHDLNLRHTQYKELAAYGHFGRDSNKYWWEKTDLAEKIRN